MAAFRGTVQGNRGEVSRLGTKKSGITARINGHKIVCKVEMNLNSEGLEQVTITLYGHRIIAEEIVKTEMEKGE